MITPRHARAFTLVEVMIFIVIGLIVAAAAIPGASTLDDQRIAADAGILAADLEFVQTRALASNQQHRIVFSTTTHEYEVQSPPGTVIEDPLTDAPWSRVLARGGIGTKLIDVSFNGATALSFDRSGRPSSGGSVTLRRGDFTATVTVTAITGDVTVTGP